jgi:hypothetical protein
MNAVAQTARTSPARQAKPVSPWKDALLLLAERMSRQAYWRSPRLRSWVRRWHADRKPVAQVAERERLKQYLRQIGVHEGALVMAHTSVTGLQLVEPGQTEAAPPKFTTLAARLVDDLLELVGPTGTLVMPSHAA